MAVTGKKGSLPTFSLLRRLLICFLLILPIVFLLTAPRPGPSPHDRMVVLISIDGLPAFSFDDPRLPAPTLRRLAAEGAEARRMLPVNPSGTWPSHTSMVTGVRPNRHGVRMNGALIRNGPRRPVSVDRWRNRSEVLRAPTVYDLAHKMGRGRVLFSRTASDDKRAYAPEGLR